MATVGQTAFGNPGNPGQFAAIQNGANSNSLVNQLFGASNVFKAPTNTSTPQTITQSPNVQAASSAVKSPATPSNASVASLLMGPLATAPTGQTTAQTGSGSAPYTPPVNTSPVVNTPTTDNPTSNPNADYTAGAAQTVNQPTQVPQVSNLGTSTAPIANTTSSGSLTQQGLLGQQEALIAQQDEQQANLTSQEQALTNNFTNMNAGILSQPGEIGYQTGRQAQLQQTENTGLAALEGQQAQLAAYEQPQLTALGNAANQLGPQSQEITPPAGGVTTIANTGQQYSNPIYEPATGAYTPLSPQPNGTPGQTPTAGQASQYAVKQGDSLTSIAAANGMTTAQLEAANPQITNPNLITPGENVNIPASGTGNTAFSGGEVTGQVAAGTNVVNLKGALGSMVSLHGQISQLLTSNPSLNSSPSALGNQLTQYLNTGVIPNGPYTQLIQDLTDYAATASAALGYGGAPTDSKTILSQSLVPTLAAGGTLDAALTNLETTVQGKVNAQTAVGQNPNAPITPSSSASSGGTVSAGGYTFVQNAQGQWVAQ